MWHCNFDTHARKSPPQMGICRCWGWSFLFRFKILQLRVNIGTRFVIHIYLVSKSWPCLTLYNCIVHCTMTILIKQNRTSKSRWSFLAAPWTTKKASAQCHPQDWYLINRGGKKRAGLTRVNWINTFLPTMHRPFTGNNMKIRRIKSLWARTGDKVLPGHGVLFKQRPSGLERIWTSGPFSQDPFVQRYPFSSLSNSIFPSASLIRFFVQVDYWLPYIAITSRGH